MLRSHNGSKRSKHGRSGNIVEAVESGVGMKTIKARRALYRTIVITMVVSWYVMTGAESLWLGLDPLARRPFTWLDACLVAAFLGGFLKLRAWYKRCPECGARLSIVDGAPHCPRCGFG